MKVEIEKLGHVFKPDGSLSWSKTHAQVPFPMDFGDRYRIYFSTRDDKGRSGVGYVETLKSDPAKVLYTSEIPCLTFGEQGMFDDSGTMPSWFIEHEGKIRMYYTGWNRSDSAAYRLAIGLAVSKDGGRTFQREYSGPVLDRGINDPIWVGQPCVLHENGTWKMWYLSCQKIEMINGRPEPFYNVRYAESADGIAWIRNEVTCIDFNETRDAIGRPFVWKMNKHYFMLHSDRNAEGYRDVPASGYRIALSESKDGLSWSPVELEISKSETGWDSVMNEYASVIQLSDNEVLMYYNGLGFGASGFGIARLKFTW